MYNCHRQLRAFYRDVVCLRPSELDQLRDKRDNLRRTLKRALARYEGLPRPMSFHAQGSFAMRTMVRFDVDYDLDDGVYFEASDLVGPRGAPISSLAIRDLVCEALQGGNWADPPEVMKNCVRVWYAQGFHIDLPIYRRRREAKAQSGLIHIRDRYELAGATWKASEPREVTRWFRATNAKLSPDGDQFRRVVCLLKAIARSRETWKPLHPSGFIIAKLAAETYKPVPGRDDVALRRAMQQLVRRIDRDHSVKHPILRDEISNRGERKVERLGEKLAEMLEWLDVLDDPDCDLDDALGAWDFVFGGWIAQWW